MAWRPYENLIDGELDNRTPGKVTGWMRFFCGDQEPLKVAFDLDGDFIEDIRGKRIALKNPNPSERYAELGRVGSYVKSLNPLQRGVVGDITAGIPIGTWTEELASRLKAQLEIVWRENGLKGTELEERRREIDADYRKRIAAGELFYAYAPYPYLEWFSDNGRVVLELDPTQIEITGSVAAREKTPEEAVADLKKRAAAMDAFMAGMVADLSKQNRKMGGDGKVSGIVV